MTDNTVIDFSSDQVDMFNESSTDVDISCESSTALEEGNHISLEKHEQNVKESPEEAKKDLTSQKKKSLEIEEGLEGRTNQNRDTEKTSKASNFEMHVKAVEQAILGTKDHEKALLVVEENALAEITSLKTNIDTESPPITEVSSHESTCSNASKRNSKKKRNSNYESSDVVFEKSTSPLKRKIIVLGFLFLFGIMTGALTALIGVLNSKNEGEIDSSNSKIFDLKSPTSSPTLTTLGTPKVPSSNPMVETVFPSPTSAPTITTAQDSTNIPTQGSTTTPIKTPTKHPTTTPTKTPTQDPTRAPTIVPTTTPTLSARNMIFALTNYLNGEYGVDVKPNSSASLAVEWLALEAILDDRDLALTPQLAQRFALLTIDYALSATTAEPTVLSVGTVNEDECSWNGVTCEDSKVTGIKFGAMNLQGSLPTEIGMLSSLVHLDVSNNQVVGTIPEELYDLTRLEKIFLYENNLSGTISSRIINLWDLSHYHLGQNKLTGTIPSTMRSNSRGIYRIRYFNVYNNEMTGTLEEGMRLRQMWYMDLGRNKFSGTLPSLAEFVRLRHLHLDFNKFTGTVPSTVVTAGDGRIQTLTLNNNSLTGDLTGDFQFYGRLGKRLPLVFTQKSVNRSVFSHVSSFYTVQYTVQNNDFSSISANTCKLNVFAGGQLPEFNSDCNVCPCSQQSIMCQYCTQ